MRHFTRLSHRNFSIDKNFYPLGSCTMKYNPRINETVAGMDGFSNIHPLQDPSTVQGALEVLYQLTEMLKQISGLPYVSLQPAAGAHGELTSLMMIKAYFEKKGEDRPIILIPDSAHGTNPASCTIAGFQVKNIHSDKRTGCTDLEDLKSQLTPQVAGLMITNPNTLGLFDINIVEIAKLMHQQGSLVYMDGANMNAIQGQALPGEFGIDIMHFNLHKTFSTPHGGGGPGAGPVAFNEKLAPFRPIPDVLRNATGEYYLNENIPESIGKVKAFFGNFSVLVRAYCYIRALGKQGILDNSTYAVLNANYVFQKLKKYFKVPYDKPCMHEFVVSCDLQAEKGVRALDIAKRLLDFGIHAPTIYFPSIVHECFMIEPTETETKE
ncbi:MAG: aminomethyl-transferring glycine dehydrogenase subunit GcvPB, partial [Planctomycetota bacterium]